MILITRLSPQRGSLGVSKKFPNTVRDGAQESSMSDVSFNYLMSGWLTSVGALLKSNWQCLAFLCASRFQFFIISSISRFLGLGKESSDSFIVFWSISLSSIANEHPGITICSRSSLIVNDTLKAISSGRNDIAESFNKAVKLQAKDGLPQQNNSWGELQMRSLSPFLNIVQKWNCRTDLVDFQFRSA